MGKKEGSSHKILVWTLLIIVRSWMSGNMWLYFQWDFSVSMLLCYRKSSSEIQEDVMDLMYASGMLSWIFVQHCKLCCSLNREDLGKHILFLSRVATGLSTSTDLDPLVIRGGGLAQSQSMFSWSFQEWQDRCAERERQCSPLSTQSRCETQGIGEHCMCVKISEARWWAWESVGDVGSRCISITLTHMPVKSHYLAGFDVSVLLNVLVASFSADPINY